MTAGEKDYNGLLKTADEKMYESKAQRKSCLGGKIRLIRKPVVRNMAAGFCAYLVEKIGP